MINRLYVQNFRCLESFTLDLADRSSVLIIGKNGSGKSTIRKALEILQTIGRGSSRVRGLLKPSDFAFHQTERPMRFEIEVDIAGKRFAYQVSFDWPATFREARITDERLTVDGETVFNREFAQVELSGSSGFRLDWHVFALSVIDERPPEQPLHQLKTFLGSLILLAPIPEMMGGYSELTTGELSADGVNFASCLRWLIEKRPAAYSAFDEFLKSLIPDFSSIENTDRGKDGKQLMVGFESPNSIVNSLTFEFDALSSGEKCFFLGAYLLARNAAGMPFVCMWDEPDNHLSISEIGQFITSMRRTARHNNQFIATSHHPETVRRFSDDSIVVLTRRSHLDPALPRYLQEIEYSGDLIDALIRNEVIE